MEKENVNEGKSFVDITMSVIERIDGLNELLEKLKEVEFTPEIILAISKREAEIRKLCDKVDEIFGGNESGNLENTESIDEGDLDNFAAQEPNGQC